MTDVAAYLARLGVERSDNANAELLHRLSEAHLYTVPFENLSVHNGEGIDLGLGALYDKIVTRRRGGFCYELNGLFGALLEELGFPVARRAARVWTGSAWGPPFDHLALIVDTPEPWLVDVGFGAHSLYPLRVEFDTDQADPGGVFRLVEAVDGQIDVLMNGAAQYRLERLSRPLSDFEIGAWWNSTSPRSHFTQGVLCALPNPRGRVTISNSTLIETTDGVRTETVVLRDELPELHLRYFGFELPEIPAVRPPVNAS